MAKHLYKIASFNIKQFSNNSAFHKEGKDSRKNLQKIADIVIDNNIDIIAIQEIRGKIAFKELMSAIAYGYCTETTAEMLEKPGADDGQTRLYTQKLGDDYLACKAGKWQGRWAHPNSKWGTAISEEGYAFIWNTDRVVLPINDRGEIQPVIKHKSEVYFVRPPFYGRFALKNNSKVEFRLLNTHILYTKNAELKDLKELGYELEDLNSSSYDQISNVLKKDPYYYNELRLQKLKKLSSMDDIKRRRAEVNNLIKEVLAREDDGGYAKYAFMLGDYNLNLENSDAKNQRASIEPVIWYREGTSEEKEFVIKQDKLTTLKTPPKEENDPNDEYGKLMFDARFANNYDHFTYNSQISQLDGRGLDISVSRLDIDNNNILGLSGRDYFNSISDHLPIIIEIEIG